VTKDEVFKTWHAVCKGESMIRIELARLKDEIAVTISGRLVAEDLGEVKRVRQSISGGVLLDLKNLLSADPKSILELRDWIEHGARTQGASPYLQLLLEPTQPTPGQAEDPH
jgi:hypothetical protein